MFPPENVISPLHRRFVTESYTISFKKGRMQNTINLKLFMLHPETGEVMDWYVTYDGKDVVDVKVEWWAVYGKVLLVN